LLFRSLPEIDGLSKETVLTSWMAKFDCIFKGISFLFNDITEARADKKVIWTVVTGSYVRVYTSRFRRPRVAGAPAFKHLLCEPKHEMSR